MMGVRERDLQRVVGNQGPFAGDDLHPQFVGGLGFNRPVAQQGGGIGGEGAAVAATGVDQAAKFDLGGRTGGQGAGVQFTFPVATMGHQRQAAGVWSVVVDDGCGRQPLAERHQHFGRGEIGHGQVGLRTGQPGDRLA